MIKDFDLVINKLDSTKKALSVTNFESYDEALWYDNSIAADSFMTKLLNNLQVEKVIISEENYALIKTTFHLKDYLAFRLNPPVIKPPVQLAANVTPKKQEVAQMVKSLPVIPATPKDTTSGKGQLPKPAEIASDKTVEKTPLKSTENSLGKPLNDQEKSIAQKVVPENSEKDNKKAVVIPKEVEKTQTAPVTAVIPKPDNVPLFKGLFGYRANEPHFIAIYIVSGKIDFEKTKAAINAYNSKNYSLMNLSVSLETADKRQVIIIGSLTDALVAKSYLIRMVKEKSLFEGLKGANYRNLLGSQKNLNVLIQQNALNQYFEFMQMYYLK